LKLYQELKIKISGIKERKLENSPCSESEDDLGGEAQQNEDSPTCC